MNGEFDALTKFDGADPGHLVGTDPITREDLERLKNQNLSPPTELLTGVIAYCDGSVDVVGNPSGAEAAYGYVIAGHVGSVNGHAWKRIASGWGLVPKEHGTTSNVGEYFAVISALEALAASGYIMVRTEIRSDSQLVIRQINGEYAVNKPHLRKLWQKVQDLKAGFPRVTFQWIPREQNKYADELASRAWKERREG